MYEISDKLYADVAEELIAVLGSKDYFSGSVCVEDGDVECELVTSLVVSHDDYDRSITSICPVWWECHATIDGYEVDNDFSFSAMTNYLFD